MKERSERWIIIPFSLGCASRSSTAVGTPGDHSKAASTSRQGSSSVVKKSKQSLGFNLPKPSISRGFRRFIRSFKNVYLLLVYKEEMEEQEEEMEIGYPTDVKHLTHVGWDGSTTTITNTNPPVKGWENLTPSEIISFPSISLKQFELAMTAQAQSTPHKPNNNKFVS